MASWSRSWAVTAVCPAGSGQEAPSGSRSVSGRHRAGAQAVPTDRPSLAGVTALIVDDNATQRGVLSDYLTDWGMTVTPPPTARPPLATVRTAAAEGRPFAVVLLDQFMPGMDGLEAEECHRRRPRSGVGRRTHDRGGPRAWNVGDAAELGMCSSLAKPIRRRDSGPACESCWASDVPRRAPYGGPTVDPAPVTRAESRVGCSWPRTI